MYDRITFLAALGAWVFILGCKAPAPRVHQGEGELVGAGPAREVIVAPRGEGVAWLADPVLASDKGHRTSNQVYLGTATFAARGAPVTMGGGVASVPGTFFFSPTGGQVGALTGWSFRKQRGALVVGDVAASKARKIGDDVSFFAFSGDGTLLGYVQDGSLYVGPADGKVPAEKIVEGISTFEFAPGGGALVTRSRSLLGGKLSLVELASGNRLSLLGESTGEYRWAPDGTRIAFTAKNDEGGYDLFMASVGKEPKKIGTGVPTFRFSSDGETLAFIGDVSYQKQFGDLFLLAPGAKEPAKIGETVTEFAFAPSSKKIAWLDKYNAQSRGGTMAWALVGPKPEVQTLEKNVPSFVWSEDGSHLAYVMRQLSPIFSIDLHVAKAEPESEPLKVGRGVFGYAFGKSDGKLYMRTNCTRNGRACDLRSLPVANLEEEPVTVARAIHTFEPANDDGSVFLITYARTDSDALDLAAVPSDGSRPPKMLDIRALPGTQLLRGEKPKVAYALIDPSRLGVYLAEIPSYDSFAVDAAAQQ